MSTVDPVTLRTPEQEQLTRFLYYLDMARVIVTRFPALDLLKKYSYDLIKELDGLRDYLQLELMLEANRAKPDVAVYEANVSRLAAVITEEFPGEPSRSEGAIDCAIRLLRERNAFWMLVRDIVPIRMSIAGDNDRKIVQGWNECLTYLRAKAGIK